MATVRLSRSCDAMPAAALKGPARPFVETEAALALSYFGLPVACNPNVARRRAHAAFGGPSTAARLLPRLVVAWKLHTITGEGKHRR